MIKISKKSQYGLRAMVFLAKKYNGPKGTPKVFSINTISEEEGIPFDFLEKIISQLEKVKLVSGKRGVKGGYMLAKEPGKINTNQVVSVLEDNKEAVDCTMCGRKKNCLTRNVWAKVNFALNQTLSSITLADLIK